MGGLLPALRLVGSICGGCLACVHFVLVVTSPPHLLQEVDRLLGDICGRVHDALPPRLGRAVCAALSAAVQSVLLDGGPYRWVGWRLLGGWASLGAGTGCMCAYWCVDSVLRLVVCDRSIQALHRSALGVRTRCPVLPFLFAPWRCRLFTPQDVGLLEADLAQVSAVYP